MPRRQYDVRGSLIPTVLQKPSFPTTLRGCISFQISYLCCENLGCWCFNLLQRGLGGVHSFNVGR